MRTFVDVGAFDGQDTAMALRYPFDRVIALEPSSCHHEGLEALTVDEPRLEVFPFGLGDKTEEVTLHNAGNLGASIYADKGTYMNYGPVGLVETIQIVEASTWWANNITEDEDVYLKINCEGSELAILTNLMEHGCSIKKAAIAWDSAKIPSLKHLTQGVKDALNFSWVPWRPEDEHRVSYSDTTKSNLIFLRSCFDDEDTQAQRRAPQRGTGNPIGHAGHTENQDEAS